MNNDTLDHHPIPLEILIDVRETAASAARGLTDEHGSMSPVGLMYTQLQLAAQALVKEIILSTARGMAGAEFKVWWGGELEKMVERMGHSLPDGYHQTMDEMGRRAEAWLAKRTSEIADALFKRALAAHAEWNASTSGVADDGSIVEVPDAPAPAGPEWVKEILEEGGKP